MAFFSESKCLPESAFSAFPSKLHFELCISWELQFTIYTVHPRFWSSHPICPTNLDTTLPDWSQVTDGGAVEENIQLNLFCWCLSSWKGAARGAWTHQIRYADDTHFSAGHQSFLGLTSVEPFESFGLYQERWGIQRGDSRSRGCGSWAKTLIFFAEDL